MKFLVDSLFGIIFSISLGGLGVVFFNYVLRKRVDFFAGFFAGCGLSIILLFITGLLGLYCRTLFIIFIVLVFLFAIPGRRSLAREGFSVDRKYIAPLILLTIVLLVAGLSSLSPPIKNDTLYYHLGLPKLWAADGGILFYPTIAFSATALNSEVLLTPIVSFISPEAAQFFVFIIGVMTMLLLAKGFSRVTNGPPIMALLVLGSVPLFVSGLTDAKNDYLAAGFALSSFLMYFEYYKTDETRSLILAGVFVGLAASTKANAIIFAIALFLILIISRHRLKDIILFCLPAVLLGAPWYLKAYVQTGNPFYPFYSSIFNSPYWHEMFDIFNKATNVQTEGRGIINFITAPFRLIYFPDIFRGRLGPMLLVFLPLAFFIRPIPGIIKKAMSIALLFFPLWYIAWPNARYLMPIIPLLALAAAYLIDRLFQIDKFPGIIAILGTCVLITLSGTQLLRDGTDRIKAAVGLLDKDQFLQTISVLDPNQLGSAGKILALPYYDIWQFLNVAAEPDAVVAILCSNWNRADGFYLDRPYLYLNPTDQIVVDFTSGRRRIARSLYDEKVRYVLIDKLVLEEFSPAGNFSDAPGFDSVSRGVSDFTTIIKNNGRLIYVTDRFELYLIDTSSAILEEPFS